MTKEQVLTKFKFKYYYRRLLYFNLKKKKIFSLQAIEKSTIPDLKNRCKGNAKNWEFYFIKELSYGAKLYILLEMKLL